MQAWALRLWVRVPCEALEQFAFSSSSGHRGTASLTLLLQMSQHSPRSWIVINYIYILSLRSLHRAQHTCVVSADTTVCMKGPLWDIWTAVPTPHHKPAHIHFYGFKFLMWCWSTHKKKVQMEMNVFIRLLKSRFQDVYQISIHHNWLP